MEYWQNHQIKIPKLGFGTYMLKGDLAITATQTALKVGYRLIDTAQIYFNEAEVGFAIKQSLIPRQDIFLTTKIWKSYLDISGVKKSFNKSLKDLKTDYVDLLLIHWPSSTVPLDDTLQAFKELKAEKKVRYLGVSNFTCELLKKAKKLCPEIITNQVEYHPLLSQQSLLKEVNGLDMFLTAYSPLARGKMINIQQILNLSKKYKKTASQIVLRWLSQQKNVVVIPKSKNPNRIKENFNIFDFKLKQADSDQIFRLNKNKHRVIDPPFAPNWD